MIFPDEFLPEIVEVAPVPIYASLDTNLGRGIVGGMMRNNAADAQSLGKIALRILAGARPQTIPVAAAHGTPIFDWQQLQRWGIDESRLPANSDIRFRVPTVWELYGSYIVATTAVVIVQLILIAGLLTPRPAAQRPCHHQARGRSRCARATTAFARWPAA